MTKEKSSNNLSPWEFAREEMCEPGVCGTNWIQKLMKVEITEADLRWNRKQRRNLQQLSEKNQLVSTTLPDTHPDVTSKDNLWNIFWNRCRAYYLNYVWYDSSGITFCQSVFDLIWLKI